MRLASAPLQSVFLKKKRVFEWVTLKNQTCTPSYLVKHKKLTLYANFHALPQKRRVPCFYSFKRRDYKVPTDFWEFSKILCSFVAKWQLFVLENQDVCLPDMGGCFSRVGYSRQNVIFSLAKNGCMFKKTILHELGHIIGLHHEQSRRDRDESLVIVYKNVSPSEYHNFDKKGCIWLY